MVCGILARAFRSGTEAKQPKLPTRKTLRLPMKIIDGAQDSVVARVAGKRRAVLANRYVEVRPEVSAIPVGGKLQLERSGLRADGAGPGYQPRKGSKKRLAK